MAKITGIEYENGEVMAVYVQALFDEKPRLFEPARARGEWVDKPNPQWKAYDIRHCSVCGWSIHKTKLRNADLNWHFCPNCGAKMKGD